MDFTDKKLKLTGLIENLLQEKVILAFSGGVDSALLLKLASKLRKNKEDILAIFFKSLSTAEGELENARALAKEMDVKLLVKDIDILSHQQIKTNAKDRCYHCKSLLFSQAIALKNDLGYGYVLDGTNTDDYKVYRPGLRALRDLGVISPLKQAGFDKKDVRNLASELGIKVAKKPAAPCLLTRFPYGTILDCKKLDRVKKGEDFLKALHIKNIRLRDHENLARIEVLPEDFNTILTNKDELISYLKSLGFSYVTLDLEGFRSGSMDENLTQEEKQRWKIDG